MTYYIALKLHLLNNDKYLGLGDLNYIAYTCSYVLSVTNLYHCKTPPGKDKII